VAIAYDVTIEDAVGGSGDDTIIGNTADNRLTGGEGSDRFVFGAVTGQDVITDFEDGFDLIDLSQTGLGFGDLVISAGATGAVIAWGDEALTLAGVEAGAIGTVDFLLG
jgi:Ca2+-binding RTX toxin-like protein